MTLANPLSNKAVGQTDGQTDGVGQVVVAIPRFA